MQWFYSFYAVHLAIRKKGDVKIGLYVGVFDARSDCGHAERNKSFSEWRTP